MGGGEQEGTRRSKGSTAQLEAIICLFRSHSNKPVWHLYNEQVHITEELALFSIELQISTRNIVLAAGGSPRFKSRRIRFSYRHP
jgi:hypothetical protein